MADQIVINTGPLVALARMDALSIPGHLPYEFVCPEEVREELEEGVRAGHQKIDPAWLEISPLRQRLPLLESSTLGKGEAAVIELALEREIRRVCIDEWKGRRAALTAGLNVVGALGLLGRAKKLGLIPAVRPFIERAVAGGVWYDEWLVHRVLEAVGEE